MKTSEFEEVKKWFRGLRINVKTLNDKIEFYNDLARISQKLRDENERFILDKEYYLERIKELEKHIKKNSELFEECLAHLDENERNIITLKYMKGIGWDYINLHTYYAKSQAVRIHNAAIKKIANNRELYHKIVKKAGGSYE